jgi:hypothetical protein
VLNPRSLSIATIFALLLGTTSATLQAEENVAPEGFTAVFNGKNLEGWWGLGHFDPRKLEAMTDDERKALRGTNVADVKTHWTVDDGDLVNDGHGVYLTTDRQYGDFEMWIDYKTVPKADSGIYLRMNPQVQIWDFTDESKFGIGADKGSGGLWNNNAGAKGKDPLVLADKALGEWNRFRIIQVGDKTSVWLNGKLIVDHAIMNNYWDRSRPQFARGHIQLQTHGGEIRWRNIFIREFSSEEATAYLREKDPAGSGFETVFDGKSFDGWAGPTSNYTIDNGTLLCQKGKGGTIYTEQEYSDFIARIEFKLPPGGNNGLAIRYPGKGNTAYVGMCELQVLDSEHAKYAKLDQRQYHGSAYGMAAAHRGYLRATGEWNYQQVTVKGATIKVELNGVTILDADLSKVTEFMDNSPHPGKDRASGHFGFAGHNDPVQYRNIQIKSLK